MTTQTPTADDARTAAEIADARSDEFAADPTPVKFNDLVSAIEAEFAELPDSRTRHTEAVQAMIDAFEAAGHETDSWLSGDDEHVVVKTEYGAGIPEVASRLHAFVAGHYDGDVHFDRHESAKWVRAVKFTFEPDA